MKKILFILMLVLCFVMSGCAVTTGSENMLLVHEALMNQTITTGRNEDMYEYSENNVNITVYFSEVSEEQINIFGYYSVPTDLETQQYLTYTFEIWYTVQVDVEDNIDISVEKEYVDRSGSIWHSSSSKYDIYNLNINDYYKNKAFDASKMDLENNFEALTFISLFGNEKIEYVQETLDALAKVLEGMNEIYKKHDIIIFE